MRPVALVAAGVALPAQHGLRGQRRQGVGGALGEAAERYTIGAWFTQAGYYTAFLGKYVNGMECDVPSGWRHWGGLTCTHWNGMQLGGTYNYYNASQWQVDFDVNGTTPITHPIVPTIWSGTTRPTSSATRASSRCARRTPRAAPSSST